MSPQPLFEMSGAGPRRGSPWKWVMLAVVLMGVGVAVWRFAGSARLLGSGHVADRLAEARKLEELSLDLSAVELYERVLADEDARDRQRMLAAERLARLYRGRLDDPRAAEAALEKAFYFAPEGEQREALRQELELLRGRPVGPGSDAAAAAVAPPDVVARIGEETVRLQDVIYTWKHFFGERQPSSRELRDFMQVYLDMVLIADEAQQREMDDLYDVAGQLRLRRLLTLNQAMSQMLMEELSVPTEEQVAAHYAEQLPNLAQGGRLKLGQLVVDDADALLAVAKAMDRGQSFAKIAREHGMDADRLEAGYIVGEFGPGDTRVPGYGEVEPEFIQRLMQYEDGTTTGPFETARGSHWLHVIEAEPPSYPPLDEAYGRMMLEYQKQRVARLRRALIERLKQTRPIEIYDAPLDRLAGDGGPAAMTSPTRAADTPTTLPPPPFRTP